MTRTIKKLVFSLYTIAVVCMGSATVIEKYQGSEFVSAHIYGTWWFALVWALLAATATVYFLRNRTKSWTGITLHLSFLVILAGAFLTHISAERGIIICASERPPTATPSLLTARTQAARACRSRYASISSAYSIIPARTPWRTTCRSSASRRTDRPCKDRYR